MILTKYAVITPNSRTEFLQEQDANDYAAQVGGTVQMVEEEIREEQPLLEDYEVALWRIKSVLKLMGLEAAVSAAISQLPEPEHTVAATAWEYAYTIARRSNTVSFVQQALQLTDEQVDEIFEQGFEINI